ncbi:MAG TPA: hypothetical protein DEW46_08455, partial [Verrucomicrobia bacterium]|nr:hypothetical protein [Verrucomicrobiota bacterium]
GRIGRIGKPRLSLPHPRGARWLLVHFVLFPGGFWSILGYDGGMNISRIILLVALFVSGFVIMGMELLGFRLMAVYFGYSNYVQGSQIGVVMLALSVGYWLGGRW